jgi:hypothetical protein
MGWLNTSVTGWLLIEASSFVKRKKNARFIPVPMCSLYLFSHSAHMQSKKRPLDENRCFESSQAKIKMEKLTAKQVLEFKITESALMNTSINHMRREEIH